MKVSVIVPVYNVEQYLSKCLNSLVKQELKELEIIIVNDGSPDNSQLIIDKYKKNYPNIRSFTKENSGLSDTRNMGIKYATGEYIAFLDSDDSVRPDMYKKMYEKAKEKDYDIVCGDVKYVYSDHEYIVKTDPMADTTNIKDVFINLYPAVCTKIFKRDLIVKNNMSFKSGVWYEDVEFMYRLLPYVKSIGVIHEPFYEYLQREKSITSSVSPKIYDYINNMNGVIEYYKEKGIYEEYKKELEYAYVRYAYATFIKTCLGYDKEAYLKAVDDAIKSVKEHFPKYRRNKYFYKSLKGLYLVLFSKMLAKILYKVRSK